MRRIPLTNPLLVFYTRKRPYCIGDEAKYATVFSISKYGCISDESFFKEGDNYVNFGGQGCDSKYYSYSEWIHLRLKVENAKHCRFVTQKTKIDKFFRDAEEYVLSQWEAEHKNGGMK